MIPRIEITALKFYQELLHNKKTDKYKLVNGLYPPGSVVKMGVGLAMLNTGIISPSTTIESTGSMELGGRVFRDWKKEVHVMISYVRAIRQSCDDYFYKTSLN